MSEPSDLPPATPASAAIPPAVPSVVVPTANTDDAAFESLHPRARWSMALGAAIGFGLLYVPPAIVLLVLWDGAGLGWLAKFGIFVLGFLLVMAWSWWYANARYRHAQFALTSDGLRIRRGVFWRSEVLVPRSRVQHTDLNRGPIDRQLGMASLKVFTAGTKLASVSLDGLPDTRAVELRDALVSDDDDAV